MAVCTVQQNGAHPFSTPLPKSAESASILSPPHIDLFMIGPARQVTHRLSKALLFQPMGTIDSQLERQRLRHCLFQADQFLSVQLSASA